MTNYKDKKTFNYIKGENDIIRVKRGEIVHVSFNFGDLETSSLYSFSIYNSIKKNVKMSELGQLPVEDGCISVDISLVNYVGSRNNLYYELKNDTTKRVISSGKFLIDKY